MIIHLPTITLIPFSLPSRCASLSPVATEVQNMQNFQILDTASNLKDKPWSQEKSV